MPVWLICSYQNCHNELKVTPSKHQRNRIFFCSRKCYQKFVKSPEGRKWNSDNLVGIKKMHTGEYHNNVNLYRGWLKWCERHKVDTGEMVPKEVQKEVF